MASDKSALALKKISPLNEGQKKVLETGKNLIVRGAAGTGKTYLLLYKALDLVHRNKFDKVIIIRSAVATRNIGFLPGSAADKTKVYEAPYESIAIDLYGREDAYKLLKRSDQVEFMTTSFIRGATLDNCYIIVDEFQNMSFHELDSIITRLGDKAKIAFSGDAFQADLQNNGLLPFTAILEKMDDIFDTVEFTVEDVVRSRIVKRYLTEKYAKRDSKVKSLLNGHSKSLEMVG